VSDNPSENLEDPVDGSKEEQEQEEEDEACRRNRAFRAECKLILIGIAVCGFFCQIILFPLLSVISNSYGWGIEFPQLDLGTISALLSSLF